MSSKPLSVDQIAELAGVSEDDVRRDMRRGVLPSQEPEVIREYLRARWEKSQRRMIREELSRG